MAEGTESSTSNLVLEPDRSGQWRTASEAEVIAFARALDNPMRREVLRLLDRGPMWKSRLGRLASKALGKRYVGSLIYYHLRPLERVGLVGVGADPEEVRARVVYRKADYQVQLRPRPQPEQLEPYTRKRAIGELRRALREEGKV